MSDESTLAVMPTLPALPERVPCPTGAPPSVYTRALAERIVDLYADGKSLRAISRMEGMPSHRTLFHWRKEDAAFSTALAHAREAKAETLADEGLEAVNAPLDLSMDGKVASAGVTRQANRANYLKWLAGCLDRATYGDALQVEAKVQAVVSCFMSQAPRAAGEAAARDVLPVVVVRDVAEDEGAA